MDDFGIPKDLLLNLKEIFSKHSEVNCVKIYGSRAKGTFREGSDVDITLIGNDIDNTILNNIEFEIDELDSPYLFDVSIYSQLSSVNLKEHIDRIGIEIYSKVL